MKVEGHNGTNYQAQVEMRYYGQGQRLAVTGYQDGQSLSSDYVVDNGGTLLAATANDQTTYYISGLAEKQQEWSYYLADGLGSVRQ